MSGRLRIVHVSADYPDPIAPAKTPVIRSLRDLVTDRFDQKVISLNRVAPTLGHLAKTGDPIVREEAFDHGIALSYAAPPLGLLHRSRLVALGDALAERLQDDKPGLLVAHKLSIEGLAVHRSARRLGVPYAVTVQGNTDLKIAAARPDLRHSFAHILRDAGAVFCFAPWAWRQLGRLLPLDGIEPIMLPCPTALDTPLAPRAGDGALISVFHLHNWRGKNLPRMARAVDGLPSANRLTIIGGGSDADTRACRELAGRHPRLGLEGPIDHAALPERLNRASGFVLPSLRESFGLVFVEALFAGLPIIYPRCAAVDGWFDGETFALPVDARDTSAIRAAMLRLLADEGRMKSALQEWQASERARAFTRPAIAESFAHGLARAARSGIPS